MINSTTFGPWAIVTGASSGIGEAFARHIAASGLNLVLVARRRVRLEQLGQELSEKFKIECQVVEADLSQGHFMNLLEPATRELDIGLVVCNAGFATPGDFLDLDLNEMIRCVQLKTTTNLVLAHHYGKRMAARGRGGILLVSSIGGLAGVPYVANNAATEAYVLALGEGLHAEFKKLGVNVTVLMPGPTATESMSKMGVDPADMPMKPMSAQQCSAEGLRALQANRPSHIAGFANRLMRSLMSRSMATRVMGNMIGKTFAGKRRIK